MNSRKQNEKLEHLASQVSPAVKDAVVQFGRSTKRTASSSVFYLLETHPAITEIMTDPQKELSLMPSSESTSP